jgi:hypothetical protein
MENLTSTNRKPHWVACSIFLASSVFTASWAQAAQAVPPQQTPAPCCVITMVEPNSVTATGRETSSGRNFQFRPVDRAVMNSLKVGQPIYADFKSKTVSIEWGKPCCQIITSGTAGGGAPGQVSPPAGWDLKDNKKM